MNHLLTYLSWLVAFTIIVIIGVVIFRKPSTPAVTPRGEQAETTQNLLCKEGETKTDQLGNIYQCIDGKYIYYGSVEEDKG